MEASINRLTRSKGKLSAADEQRLAEAAAAGDLKARNALIEQYTPMVAGLARKFAKKTVISFEEMFSAGMVGLCEAADRFDPTVGVRFGTYTVFWCRSRMQDQALTMSLPVKAPTSSDRKALFWQLRARQMTLEGKHPDWSRREINTEIARQLGLPYADVERFDAQLGSTVHLDAPAHSGEDATETHGDRLPADGLSPEEATQTACDGERLSASLYEALKALPARERDIVASRHLIDYDDEGATLADLGERYGISRERVRQLEQKAFKTLRKILEDDWVAEEMLA